MVKSANATTADSPRRPPGHAAQERAPARANQRNTRRLVLSSRTIVTHGLQRKVLQDLYHLFMTVSWPSLIGWLAAYFFAFNVLFAILYSLVPGCISNVNPEGFWGNFFFSFETFATVGYGDMHPQTLYGHVIGSVEIFVGVISMALLTGAMFARFSRPRARFLFARYGVVHPMDGRPTLMFRAANARQNIIMEASAQLRLMRDAMTAEGYRYRRIVDLPLVRSEHPIFLLGWNLMHVLDANSPLAGETPESLAQSRALFLLTLSGTDETTGQVLMARHDYSSEAIRWNHLFRDVLHLGSDGLEHFDYTKFHLVDPMDSLPDEGS